jgi:periplasmic divalent cation tolerance protein
MADEILLVLSTFPDEATARRIGRHLVEEKCAACANILTPVQSIYRWQGKIEEANETLVLFKTAARRFGALQTTLRELHPYDVPEIIAFSAKDGLPEYLRWVSENCS